MNRIEQLIKQYCPDGVPKVTLDKVMSVSTGGQLNKSAMVEDAPYPVVNGGIDYSGYTENFNTPANSITISQGGASAGYTQWIDCDFWAGAHCYVVTPYNNINKRFLFHLLKNKERALMENKQGAGIPGLNRKAVYTIEISLPPLEVQQEIVSILDTFTDMIDNLNEELEMKQKQMQHYSDVFFGTSVEELLLSKESGSVTVVPISELGSITRGKRFVRDDVREEGQPCIHYGDMYTFYGTKAFTARTFLDRDFPKKMRYAKKGDVIVVGAGENDWDIGVGMVWLGEEPAAVHDACYILEHNENAMYISYYLRSTVYHLQLRKHVSSGKISSFSGDGLGKVFIPLPSSEKQAEIVSILDTFEESIENIKEEIELRQKQYEYYREKLLTFE